MLFSSTEHESHHNIMWQRKETIKYLNLFHKDNTRHTTYLSTPPPTKIKFLKQNKSVRRYLLDNTMVISTCHCTLGSLSEGPNSSEFAYAQLQQSNSLIFSDLIFMIIMLGRILEVVTECDLYNSRLIYLPTEKHFDNKYGYLYSNLCVVVGTANYMLQE